ncbi:hypothetical protein FI667_g15377, partial [Globisporangium splendens]
MALNNTHLAFLCAFSPSGYSESSSGEDPEAAPCALHTASAAAMAAAAEPREAQLVQGARARGRRSGLCADSGLRGRALGCFGCDLVGNSGCKARSGTKHVAVGVYDRGDSSVRLLARLLPAWVAICKLRWWRPADEGVLHDAEHTIYRNFVPDKVHLRHIAGLGTVHVPHSGEEAPPRALVLVHGYLAGNAFWAANLEELPKHFDVFAVEWKGIGRSVRPTFIPKNDEEADTFFVESLEELRREMQHFALYCYHNWALKASGDIAYHTHLHPGASARTRALSELLVLGKASVSVTFLYGDAGVDWMNHEHGEAVVRQLEKSQYVVLRRVPLAGHQVFMDNPKGFNRALLQAINDHDVHMGNFN